MPPLRPDAPTARRWLSEELRHSRYRDGESLLDRLNDWLNSLFEPGNATAQPVGTIVAVLLAAMLLTAVIFAVGRLRRNARVRTTEPDPPGDLGPLDDPDRHRRAAAGHREAGDHAAAVIESFRALVAEAGRRQAIVLIPGLTGQQAARQLAQRYDDFATELRRAADCFDRARYADARSSRAPVTAEDATALAELDRALLDQALPDRGRRQPIGSRADR